jgi:anti-sigma B factor antagonist
MSTQRLSSTASAPCLPEDQLTLRLVDAGSLAVIEVAGELDMDTTHVLTVLAESVLHTQAPPVMILDLTGLQFLCADGIRALLQVHDAACAQAARLILRNPSAITCRLLKLTGTLDVFEIEQSRSPSTAGSCP